MIFKRYDKDCDGKLSYEEFIGLILPRDSYLAKDIAARRDIRMSSDSIELMRKILRAHLNIEESHEYLRLRLKKVAE